MEPFLGEIRLLPYSFAPVGWAECNGQSLQIRSNTALFAIIGTQYGGNGQTTFNLPDLRGRTGIGAGTGPGLNTVGPGLQGGVEQVALATAQMPSHSHRINYKSVPNSNTPMTATPSNTVLLSRTAASDSAPATGFAKPANGVPTPATTMRADMIGSTGAGQGHENRQPFLVMRYCIATTGVFPQRQ